jgi:hypothetical protein
MSTLVLVFCLLPNQCVEHRPYEPMPALHCIAMVQPAAAKYLGENPGWQLVHGRCEEPRKRRSIEQAEEWPRDPQGVKLWH